MGCGGSVLRSAIEIKKYCLYLYMLCKKKKTDLHAFLAACSVNAALGNLDKETYGGKF